MSTPEIRFEGFTDDWEQHKLYEIGQIVTGTTPPTSDAENYNGDLLFVSPADIDDNRYITKTITTVSEKGFNTGREIRKGASLFVSIGSSIGKVAQMAEKAITNQQINAVVPNDNYDDDFVLSLLETQSSNVKAIASNQAVPIVNKSTFSNIDILVPPNITEQQKMGKYFANPDNLITLHQRKCESLQHLKSAMLVKMFPKQGETKPEIRFEGFTDDWEQRKLGECCQEFKSGSFISASDIGDVGKYPVYGGNGLRGFSAEYNHDGEFALIGRQGALCGNMNYSVGRAYFTEHAIAVQANKTADTKFLYYLLRKMNLGQYSDQSAQPGLAVGKLVKLTELFPSVAEQIKIGHQFMGIDNLITLHQRKCESLQHLKSALLHKIFVSK